MVTQGQEMEIERVQKVALRIILKEEYDICSAPIWSVFSGLWSGSRLFLKKIVWKWSGFTPKSPDLTKLASLNMHLMMLWTWCRARKVEKFPIKPSKYPILWYWSGLGAHLGPDLVWFCIEKWFVFGPILVNLSPIWQMVALHAC